MVCVYAKAVIQFWKDMLFSRVLWVLLYYYYVTLFLGFFHPEILSFTISAYYCFVLQPLIYECYAVTILDVMIFDGLIISLDNPLQAIVMFDFKSPTNQYSFDVEFHLWYEGEGGLLVKHTKKERKKFILCLNNSC